MNGPTIRDCAEVATRAYLRRHGIEPGQRPSGADPQLTYQSDLSDDEVGNIHIGRPVELAEILQDALPEGIAELVAEATQRREYWANTEQAQRWRTDVEYIVRSHLEREAGL